MSYEMKPGPKGAFFVCRERNGDSKCTFLHHGQYPAWLEMQTWRNAGERMARHVFAKKRQTTHGDQN